MNQDSITIDMKNIYSLKKQMSDLRKQHPSELDNDFLKRFILKIQSNLLDDIIKDPSLETLHNDVNIAFSKLDEPRPYARKIAIVKRLDVQDDERAYAEESRFER